MRIKFKLDLLPQSDGDILMDFSPTIDVVNGVQTNYCIENDVVKAYREDVNYTEKYIVVSPTDANIADGAKPSLIANYTKFIVQDRPNSSWTERPRPVLLFGTRTGNTVTLASASHTMQVESGNGVTIVYNLIPNVTYHWTESNTNLQGSFTTTGQTRMIKIPLFNFRDIGGWPCYDDEGNLTGRIKYGQCYRGMCWARTKKEDGTYKGGSWTCFENRLYPEVTEQLMELGVTDDIDLRGWKKGNQAKSEDDYSKGAHAVDPIYPTIDGRKITYNQGEIPAYTFVTQITNYFTYNYNAATDTAPTRYAYQNLISHLEIVAETGRVPYVHCATGADRTGVFFATLMALLGCSINDIAKEYEYTTFNGGGQRVNLGYIENGKAKGKPDSNIRTFLTAFGTSGLAENTLGRTTVNRIVAWVRGLYLRDHTEAQWTEFLTRLKAKMIEAV